MRKWIGWIKTILFVIGCGVVATVVGGLILNYLTLSEKNISISIDGPFDLVTLNKLFKKKNVSFEFNYKWEAEKESSKQEEQALDHSSQTPPPETRTEKLPYVPLRPPTITSVRTFVKSDDAQIYRISLKNSGKVELTDLPLRLIFIPKNKDFKIVSLEHNTMPKNNFSEIKHTYEEKLEVLITYSLLNPGDRDVITLLATQDALLTMAVKTKGLSYETSSASDTRKFQLRSILPALISDKLCE